MHGSNVRLRMCNYGLYFIAVQRVLLENGKCFVLFLHDAIVSPSSVPLFWSGRDFVVIVASRWLNSSVFGGTKIVAGWIWATLNVKHGYYLYDAHFSTPFFQCIHFCLFYFSTIFSVYLYVASQVNEDKYKNRYTDWENEQLQLPFHSIQR